MGNVLNSTNVCKKKTETVKFDTKFWIGNSQYSTILFVYLVSQFIQFAIT